ncbi:hypothetical protein [Sinorhizobium psoraleae]|uniref:Uncharacterized protein n=1 Tax=Sinorhizobium psoraleae TaxID=520838 RepID=A0ABT4KAT7_9HYPH|nr:hypothetical protein [Sinorhizobium psoraleae]MCZ4089076.1 hypothetical protein [Sinorhizobium psoraleae]
MEDESNNSVMETAPSYDDVVAQIEASYDMPEASDISEQANEHVEQEPVAEDAVETPSEEPIFRYRRGTNPAFRKSAIG